VRKYLLLCLFFVHSLYAYVYNDLLLKTQATIFPKIILLDQNLVDKLHNNTVTLAIVYEKEDFYIAQNIQKLIEKHYNSLLDEYKFHVILLDISKIKNFNEKVTAFYVLHLSENNVTEVSQLAAEKDIITFSYDLENLQKGLLFSVTIEQAPTFYLNKKNLYPENVNFVPPLLQMVKFID